MRVVLNKRNSLVEVPSTEETLSVIVQTAGKAFIKFHGNQLHSIGCAEGKELTLLSTLPEFWHTDLTYLLYVDNYTLRFATSKPCQRIPLPVTNISTGQVEPEGILGGISTEEDQESGLTLFVFGSQSDYYGDNAVVTPNQSVEQFPNKEWLIGDFPSSGGGGSSNVVPVDLGLSVDWSPVNVGANDPAESGFWLRYMDLEDQSAIEDPRSNDPMSIIDDDYQYLYEHHSEYSSQEELMSAIKSMHEIYAEVDWNNEVSGNEHSGYPATLIGTHDVATVNMGSGWRLPTISEIQELINNTTQEEVDGGILFTSTVPGYENNSILIPYVGIRGMLDGNSMIHTGEGQVALLWSSSILIDDTLNFGYMSLFQLYGGNALLASPEESYSDSQMLACPFIMNLQGHTPDLEHELRFFLGSARGVHEK